MGQQNHDEDDELNFEPDEVSQMRDPGYYFEQSRAFAAFKLKSTFEHIFEKYEKDFTGIGDEIDLRTGKILTNNGHLEKMRNERDTGIQNPEDEEEDGVLLEDAFRSDGEDDEDEASEADEDEEANPPTNGDEERIGLGKTLKPIESGDFESSEGPLVRPDSKPGLADTTKGQVQPPSNPATSHRPGTGELKSSANVWGSDPESVDPTWQVPDIDTPRIEDVVMSKMSGSRYRIPATRGYKSVWSSRQDSEEERMASEPAQVDIAMLVRARHESFRIGRATSMKPLPAFNTDDDNEDDILAMSIAEKKLRAKKNAVVAAITEKVIADGSGAPAEKQQRISTEHGQAHKESAHLPLAKKRNDGSFKAPSTPKQHEPEKPQSIRDKPRRSRTSRRIRANNDDPNSSGIQLAPASDDPMSSAKETMHQRAHQRLVVEIFSRPPVAEELSHFVDPDDIDTFISDDQQHPLPQTDADTTMLGQPLQVLKSEIAGANGAPDEEIAEEAPSEAMKQNEDPRETPQEKFTRHEIDPSYAFSDDEDEIPRAKTRAGRLEKPDIIVGAVAASPTIGHAVASLAVPGDIDVVEREPEVTTFQSNKQALELDQGSQDPDISTGRGESPLSETDAMNIDEATEVQPKLNMEVFLTDVLVQQHNDPEQTVEEPLTPDDQLVEEIAQEQPVQGTATPEEQPENTHDAIILSSSPAIPLDRSQSPISEDEENEGFAIPLDLDDMDASGAETEPEPEPQPEVQPESEMDLELPVIPVAVDEEPTPTLSSRPRRGRPPKSGNRVQRSMTSPMRHLNLHSSSPLRRYAINKNTPIPLDEPETSTAPAEPSSPQTLPIHPPPPAAKPSPRPRPKPSTPSNSRTYSSLIPDDEDELTIDLFKTWTASGSSSYASRRLTPFAPVLLAGPHTKMSTPRTHHSHVPSSDAGASENRGKKRKAAWAYASTPTKVHIGSPSKSLIKTPGGHLRRCGEEGFKCDRDFCFTCL
ncbi:hypothetical protein C8035_v002436 [Colletotrichum spinosum]|uniref:Centromere protein Scm3 n=1 Tax=Colletotrichum spinosum TaxID=1347390 RepID=A0A4R8Q5L1_9PEZI|nr:hypothetical protein C8035_v002436 [Colletotrichum spinosum]